MSLYYPQASVILKVIFEDFKGNTKTADLKTIYKLPIIARDVEVCINDYTQADTFSMEIDYKNFPFDPRCIRSCGVSIFIQDMGSVFQAGNALNTIEPDADNIVFQGFADEDSITFDEEHRAVRLEGRDFTGLMTDLKAPAVAISTDVPLDTLINSFLQSNESLREIKVDNRTNELLPTVADYAPGFLPQQTKKNPRPNESLWDLLTELVSQAALICYVEIDKLVITKPRLLYGRAKVKQFIYGHNIQTLEFKRKLGRKKGYNIRCISLNGKTVESAEIPRESTKAWSDSIGIAQSDVTIPQIAADGSPANPILAPFVTFRFPNKTKQFLIEKGQSIYEEVGRQQIEGSLTTKEMEIAELTEKSKDFVSFNATQMRNGTPIEIGIEQGDLAGMSELKTSSQRESFLEHRGYQPNVAKAFARSFGQFKSKFYTKAVTFTLNQESGFKMKVDFINFIELENEGLKS